MWGLICVSPAILGFLLWDIGPMIASIVLSFSDWSVTGTTSWIGTENFQRLFGDDALFRQSAQVTLTYAFVSVPLQIIVAMALALLLNEKVKGLPIFRTIFYVPSTVPLIASSMIWLWMYNPDFGLFNAVLNFFGLPEQQWIFSSDTVVLSLIIMSLWSIGPMMIIFLAGLTAIPQHLYDAVSVDGGNVFNRLWTVTIPMLTPTILFNLVLSVITSLQTFTQAYVMTDGGPGNASLFYGLYLYRTAFQQGEFGYAASLAVVQFAVIVVLSLLVFRTSSRWVHYGGDT
ncbi:MAG: sugar ABC transporter permease [Chloroflexia bacterium]|jgi:multiple sugar transport system permease protein|nr:sugar ABC transporter permease [Chloroflexia bacterium]MDQ3613095.1 sugar ABC transporter permease [Chloroflexota bacterium]